MPTRLAQLLRLAPVIMDLMTAGTCEPVCSNGCGANSACTEPEVCTCDNGYDDSATAGTCEPICSNGCGANSACTAPETSLVIELMMILPLLELVNLFVQIVVVPTQRAQHQRPALVTMAMTTLPLLEYVNQFVQMDVVPIQLALPLRLAAVIMVLTILHCWNV